MIHLMARNRTVSGILSLFALTAGLSACSSETLQDSADVQMPTTEAAAAQPQVSLKGLPDFHKPPHERNASAAEAAKLSSGYHYAQGQLDESTYYGIYTYIDSSWTYMSTSIWGSDNSSLSSGMDISSSGDTWLQSGSYYLDGALAKGDYATSYISANGVGTMYLTDFSSSTDFSEYHSVIDYSNTAASPDCTYDSIWANDSSAAHQLCFRPDESYWSCDYSYSYESLVDVNGDAVGVKYLSQQSCNDSATVDRDPDYSYSDSMVWDYLTGSYSDSATMVCYEKEGGVKRTFTYTYEDGVSSWADENGIAVAGPSCGWELAGN